MWFGCSATVDEETELKVLKSTGFRPIRHAMYETEVIRTSINQPDVSVFVIPIPKGKITRWDPLYFLIDDAVSSANSADTATPEYIPKTVVFINGRMSL